MASPTLDGHNAGNHSGGSSTTISLTTTLTNDIIVVAVYNESASATLRTVSSVSDTALLSWSPRAAISGLHNSAGDLELYWAFSAGILTGDVITINLSGATDDWSYVVFGVNGCYTAAPWDTNTSVPNKTAYLASTTPTATISTTENDDFIIAVMGATNNQVGEQTSIPSGFSSIDHTGTSGGALFSEISAASLAVSGQQNSLVVTWGSGVGAGSGPLLYIVDALTANGPTITFPSDRQGMRRQLRIR